MVRLTYDRCLCELRSNTRLPDDVGKTSSGNTELKTSKSVVVVVLENHPILYFLSRSSTQGTGI